MIINSNINIAIKNTIGQYSIDKFSIFRIKQINDEFTSLKISVNHKREIVIRIKCPLCEGFHLYKYSFNDFINRDVLVGGCEIVGVPVFYIGDRNKVIDRVKKYNKVNKNIYAMV